VRIRIGVPRLLLSGLLAVIIGGIYNGAPALACSAVQEANCLEMGIYVPCSGSWQLGGTKIIGSTMYGAEATIDTWNPSPVWLRSSDWIMETSTSSGKYAQIGTMHITGNGNAQVFIYYKNNSGGTSNVLFPAGTSYYPSGSVQYGVFDYSSGGYTAFSANSYEWDYSDITWKPDQVQSSAEINSAKNSSNYGDAGYGDKTHYMFNTNVGWVDSSIVNHAISSDRLNGLSYTAASAAQYQNYTLSSGNTWGTWDSRCG